MIRYDAASSFIENTDKLGVHEYFGQGNKAFALAMAFDELELRIPIQGGQVFQPDGGHPSEGGPPGCAIAGLVAQTMSSGTPAAWRRWRSAVQSCGRYSR